MRLSDYDVMLNALFGADIPLGACMAVWEPMGDYWRSSACNDVISFPNFNNTVLVRHVENVLPAGAGRRIGTLHRETFQEYLTARESYAVEEYLGGQTGRLMRHSGFSQAGLTLPVLDRWYLDRSGGRQTQNRRVA